MTNRLRKNILKIFLATSLILMPSFASAQNSRPDYQVRDTEVYYHQERIKDADADSFHNLGFGYGKDRYHVYKDGEILEYVDPEPFRIDPRYGGHQQGREENRERGGYFKSTFDVFYNGRKIEDATPSSFQEIGGGYAKDAFNVYYRGKKVEDASPSSFQYKGKGYARDSFNTYFYGKKISN